MAKDAASWDELGEKILAAARNELYLNLPFLDAALCALTPSREEATDFLATDAKRLFYSGSYLAMRYEKGRSLVCRAYLHLLLHCLLRHPQQCRGRDDALWDLACDVAVESVLDSLDYPCLRARVDSPRRRAWYARLAREMRVPTAQAVYRYLRREGLPEYERATLAREFFEDDHGPWRRAQDGAGGESWQRIAERTQTGMETVLHGAGRGGEAVLEQLRVENRPRTDYRAFLRRFAALGEEMRVDADAFDYGYYAYGLRRYGNMPLIEPLETKETFRIEDFVIAIDTSMSTSGALVRSFLSYTYSILKSTESFSRRVHLRILQCDDRLRADRRITSAEELADYMAHFELIGQGATDFRPVFEHVDALVRAGQFRHLRGLLYFTDGLGAYPARRPAYDAAFVMLAGQAAPERVPPWGIRIFLDEDELTQGGRP